MQVPGGPKPFTHSRNIASRETKNFLLHARAYVKGILQHMVKSSERLMNGACQNVSR